jgi:hypothetical protein
MWNIIFVPLYFIYLTDKASCSLWKFSALRPWNDQPCHICLHERSFWCVWPFINISLTLNLYPLALFWFYSAHSASINLNTLWKEFIQTTHFTRITAGDRHGIATRTSMKSGTFSKNKWHHKSMNLELHWLKNMHRFKQNDNA